MKSLSFPEINFRLFLFFQSRIETQKGENAILRQKLQSKSEALLILTKELEKSRSEGDEYRELAQRLQTKCAGLKGAMYQIGGSSLAEQEGSFNSR